MSVIVVFGWDAGMGCGEEVVVGEYDTIRHLHLALTAYNLPAYQIGYWNWNRTHTIIIVFSLLTSSDSGVCRPLVLFQPTYTRVFYFPRLCAIINHQSRDPRIERIGTFGFRHTTLDYPRTSIPPPELRPRATKRY